MATGAQVSLYYIKETVPGTTPATPAWKALGFSSIALKRNQPAVQSERIRKDRMASPGVNGVIEVSGDLSTELVYGEQDDLLGGVFGADWATNVLKIGNQTVTPSFSILEQMEGVAGKKFRIYTGCVVNTFSLSQEAGAIVKATYGFVGMDGGFLAAAPTGSTFGAPSSNLPMTAMIGAITLDGATLANCTALGLEIDNGAESRPVVGSYKSLPITHRTSNVTGTATLYYEDSALAEKAQTEERIAISFECKDGVGNKYVFAATKVKPSDAWPEISGPEDIMMEVALSFDPDNATGTNVSITRVPKV